MTPIQCSVPSGPTGHSTRLVPKSGIRLTISQIPATPRAVSAASLEFIGPRSPAQVLHERSLGHSGPGCGARDSRTSLRGLSVRKLHVYSQKGEPSEKVICVTNHSKCDKTHRQPWLPWPTMTALRGSIAALTEVRS